MELRYSLTENDFLQQRLYLASKCKFEKRQIKMINKGIIFSLLFVLMIFFITMKVITIYVFTALIIFYVCISSAYLRWVYKVNMKKYVDSTCLKKCGIVTTLKFEEDSFLMSNLIVDSRFKFSGFKNISEVEDYFFVTLKTDENFIIPKPYIQNNEAFRDQLLFIAKKQEIDFVSDLEWKW